MVKLKPKVIAGAETIYSADRDTPFSLGKAGGAGFGFNAAHSMGWKILRRRLAATLNWRLNSEQRA